MGRYICNPDVVTLDLTGDQVRTLLNQQFAKDRNRIMSISGLSYTWDNKYAIGSKVVDIFLPNGQKIDPAGVYHIAVNNFMADGGDGFIVLKGIKRTTLKTDLDTLIDYVQAQPRPIYSEIEGRITLLDTTAPAAPVVDKVTDSATKVTGTAEVGAKVEVKNGVNVIGFATAGTDGKYTVTIKAQAEGTVLAVTSTDAAGNVSDVSNVTVTDGTAPVAPVVHEVTDKANTVTGTTEAGATVEVKANGVTLNSAPVIAAEDGSFTVGIPVQAAGTELVVIATDAALNKSETKVTVIDVTDPANAPVLDPINNTSRVLSGSNAEPGSKVVIATSYGLKITLTADSAGKFSTSLFQSFREGTVLYVFCIDAARNLSPIGSSIVSDVIAPNKAVVDAVSNKDKVLTGKAEAGSTVTVSNSKGVLGTATTGVNGKFSVTLSSVQPANTVLTVVVSDPSLNKSVTTVKVLDKIAPVVSGVINNGIYNKNVTVKFNEGTATLDGKAFRSGTLVTTEGVHTLVVTDAAGNKTIVKFTIYKTAPKVTGVAHNGLYNKDVTIYFNEGKALLNGKAAPNKTIVKTGGSYTVVVTDATGNKTTVKFTIDKKAPWTPSVNKITVNTTKVTGKTSAYSTVFVKVGGKVIGSRTADKYGKFSIKIAKQKAGKVVTVVAKDKAGNVSKAKKIIVMD